ncbi:hypothetical protein M7I_6654 [Glarea lozoyensis 74030]|uniref:Uncharacterized protein n=1 Tax=Glarea lozoyensis (strain ATCC 74030 / MF5533) TaxID=1104152 RepID=H0EV60_GLAL7|nr:hypothetical protein M7I_6654 [Glarea lozoyensis 74030]
MNPLYVGMPKIAQHDVDRSSLEFKALKFENPSMEEITLTQDGVLHNPSMYTPTLDSFKAGSYLVTNGSFGAKAIIDVQMPEIHATKPQSDQGVFKQVVPIVDIDQLTAYATEVVGNEYVETALAGKTKLHLGALPVVNVNYNSTSRYKGLNGLKGFNVTNVRINITAAAGTPNLVGNAFVPNPSVMTIEMGNVTLSLRTEKAGFIGTTTIPNFTLVPGDNNFPMTGTLNQTAVLASMVDGIATMLIKGQNVTYNGVALTYYEAALASHELVLPMNVLQIVADSAKPE